MSPSVKVSADDKLVAVYRGYRQRKRLEAVRQEFESIARTVEAGFELDVEWLGEFRLKPAIYNRELEEALFAGHSKSSRPLVHSKTATNNNDNNIKTATDNGLPLKSGPVLEELKQVEAAVQCETEIVIDSRQPLQRCTSDSSVQTCLLRDDQRQQDEAVSVEAFTQVSPIITAPSSPNRSQATSADITTKQLNHEDNARIPGGVSEIVAVEETDDIRMNEGDSEPISRSDLFLPSSDVTETTEDPECQSSIAQSVHEVAEEVDLSSEIACISAAEVDKTQTTCSIAATIADGTVITQENGSESQNPVTTSSNNLLAVELIAKNPLELLQLRLDSLPPSDNGSSSDEHIQLSTAAVFSNNIEHDTICMAIPDKSPILQEHTVLLRTLLPQETFQSSDSYSTTSETPCGTVAKTRSAGDKANELITPIVERIADPISSDNCDSKTGIVVSGGNFEQDRGSNQDSVKTKGDTILINDYDDDDDDIPPPAHEPDTVTTRRPTSAEPMTLADDTFCRSFTSSCIGDILQTLPVSVLSAVESTVTESTAAVRNGPRMANDVLSEYDMLGTEELLKLREELRQEIASIEREIQAISKT